MNRYCLEMYYLNANVQMLVFILHFFLSPEQVQHNSKGLKTGRREVVCPSWLA